MIKKASFPGCYLQGENILKGLEGVPELEGRRLFVLATSHTVTHIIPEYLPFWTERCAVEYEKFSGRCTWDEINRVLGIAGASDCDVIMGLGGGKAIDTARVVANKLKATYIAAPTIAATDAPTASACVVYGNDGAIVDYFTTRNPDYVLADTGIIARAPSRFLVSGMGDALATWFEAEVCDRAGFKNISGGFNLRAVMAIARLCYETLLEYGQDAKQACDDNRVTPALEHIVEANTLMSGLGFESGGLSTAHGVHDCLCNMEETHGYYHGEKVAFGTLTSLFLDERSRETRQEVYGFCRSVGLPVTLAEIGLGNVTDQQLKAAIAPVFDNKDSYLHNTGSDLTKETIVTAIRKADAYGV